MYFLTTLAATLITALFYFLFRKVRKLHLEVLLIAYGSATVMWLIDCFHSLIKGEGFLSIEIPTDIYISLLTIFLGLAFWLIVALVMNHHSKSNS